MYTQALFYNILCPFSNTNGSLENYMSQTSDILSVFIKQNINY